MVASVDKNIFIRAYNVGFGNCFLITFTDKGRAGKPVPRNIMIDFGCAPGESRVAFGAIMENIFQVTNGHLDVVVVSHEHTDHVSGFLDQKEAFEKFQVDHVWMGAPSKPNYYKGETASTIERIRKLTGPFQARMRDEKAKMASSFETLLENNLGSSAEIDFVRSLPSNKRNVMYLKRGDSVRRPFSRSVSVKVLAPHECVSCYFNGNDDFDLYDLMQELGMVAKRLEGKLLKENEILHPMFSNSNFENVRCVEGTPPAFSSREVRILREKNRTFGVSEFRALDSAINNTSLVLSLTIHGKKLFFPGDAEWASWYWMKHCDHCVRSMDNGDVPEDDCSFCATRIREFHSYDFVKLSQHGSRSGTPLEIFNGLKSTAKIMVTGKPNVYGIKSKIPDPDVMKMLLKNRAAENVIQFDPVDGPLWIQTQI